MKWNYSVVQCKYITYCGNKQYPAHKVYIDGNEYLIPCNIRTLTVDHIVNMEEWSPSNEGYIIQDSKTNLIGIYCL